MRSVEVGLEVLLGGTDEVWKSLKLYVVSLDGALDMDEAWGSAQQ